MRAYWKHVDGQIKGNLGKIKYPKNRSEFEIQSRVFVGLASLGFDVRGEVRTTTGKSSLDLVVFDSNKSPVLILEIKKDTPRSMVGIHRVDKTKENIRRRVAREKQHAKYSAYGIPVVWIEGMEQSEEFLKDVAANGLPSVSSQQYASEQSIEVADHPLMTRQEIMAMLRKLPPSIREIFRGWRIAWRW